VDPAHLNRIDLNLLVRFAALADERSVTGAARRLGLSQPATSAALARLRDLLGDELLVRDGREMRLTARAQALRAPVAEILARVQTTLAPSPAFEPSQSRREFRVLLADFAGELLLPALAERIEREAPLATLRVRSSYPVTPGVLAESPVDLWVISAQLRDPRRPFQRLLEDEWLVIGSARFHRRSERTLDGAALAKLRFVIGDEQLEANLGSQTPETREFRRRVRAALVYDRWEVGMLRGSALVRAVPARLARKLCAGGELVPVGKLANAAPHSLALQWPAERDADPGARWLRERVTELAAELADG
jgi:DNA-binding transcriptional LysR family regulator